MHLQRSNAQRVFFFLTLVTTTNHSSHAYVPISPRTASMFGGTGSPCPPADWPSCMKFAMPLTPRTASSSCSVPRPPPPTTSSPNGSTASPTAEAINPILRLGGYPLVPDELKMLH